MTDIVSTIVSAFTAWITGLTGGITSAFTQLFIKGDGLSELGVFLLTFLGIGVATGLVYLVLRMIRK